MRKIKLLLAAMAAMVGLGVNAQTWSTPEEASYYLYNVGTGQYFTKGNGWGTQASITESGSTDNALAVTLLAVGDKYVISIKSGSRIYGLEYLDGGTIYTDQSREKNATWTFTQVGTDDGPVFNIVSADNHGGGSGAYLTASSGNTIVGPGNDGTSAYAKWKLLAIEGPNKATIKSALLEAMASATQESPVDATALIEDATFDSNLYKGDIWTITASNKNLYGGPDSNPVAESWRSAFTLGQTITVPNGYYRVRAQGFIREYTVTGANYPVVYINGAEGTPFKKMVTETAQLNTVAGYFSNGDNGEYYWTEWTEPVKVTGKSITVGVRGTRTDTWCVWDNFQLQYLGPLDLSEYADALANVVSAAEEVEGTIPTALYNSIAAVVTEKNKAYENEEDYTNAILAINEAVSTYASSAIKAAYAAYAALDAKADILVAVANDNASANETFASAISAAATAVETTTTVDEINGVTTTLKAAMITYASAANPTGDAMFDLTFMLTNPDLTGLGNGAKDGWYTDQTQPSQNSQAMTTNNAVANLADNTKYAMYEYWSNNTEATSGFTVYQKVVLPEGTYRMDALAVAGYGSGNRYSDQATKNITFSANDVDGTKITTTTLEPATLEFVQTVEGEVKIGLKAHEGNTSNWMGIGYVTFYKVAPKTYTINETEDYDNSQEGAGDVTLNRTIKEGYNTLVLPFSMTQDEVEATFGEGSVVYAVSSYDSETDNITFVTKSGIQANEAYILKATVAGTSYNIEGRTIVAGTPQYDGTNVSMIGSYEASAEIEKDANNYVISGGKLYLVDSDNVGVKTTRAYIKVTKPEPLSVKVLSMTFDGGEATAIKALGIDKIQTGVMFNLAGQRVQKAQKGIYIMNGKKYIVK